MEIDFKQLYRKEGIAGALVVIGIILAFFYPVWGALFAGVGCGLGFFEEIYPRDVFKTLLFLGMLLYLLIAIPFFVIAFAVSYGVQYGMRLVSNKD